MEVVTFTPTDGWDAMDCADTEESPFPSTRSTGPKLVGTRWIVQIEDGDEAMGVAVSRDGTIVAAACRNGTARLLAADDGRPLGSLQLGPPGSGSSLGACTCLRFRRDAMRRSAPACCMPCARDRGTLTPAVFAQA